MSAAQSSKCLQGKSRCLWILTVTKPSLVPTLPYWSPATSLSPATATWSSPIRSCSGCRARGGGTLMVWSTERPMRTLVGNLHQRLLCYSLYQDEWFNNAYCYEIRIGILEPVFLWARRLKSNVGWNWNGCRFGMKFLTLSLHFFLCGFCAKM